jgi:hypothetical protein
MAWRSIQCWDYTFTQAANLHVTLGFDNCRAAIPYAASEHGSIDVIHTDQAECNPRGTTQIYEQRSDVPLRYEHNQSDRVILTGNFMRPSKS